MNSSRVFFNRILFPISLVVLLAAAAGAAHVAPARGADARAAAVPATARITNGTDVAEERRAGMWPFLVSVGSRDADAYQAHFCGGSLIHPRLVLTAAHCIEDVDDDGDVVRVAPSGLSVLAGVPDLAQAGGGQRIPVVDTFLHPKWQARRSRNDIAVLRLARPVQVTGAVQLGSVVQPSQDAWWGAGAGKAATVEAGPWAAGWGNNAVWSEKDNYPTVLKEVLIPLASDAQCAATTDPGMGTFDGGYSKAQYTCGGIPDSDRDGSNGSTGSDTCQGDSGGPLVVGDGIGSWAIAGLVSYGGDCGANNYTAYTRLASYRGWLAKVRPAGPGPGGIAAVTNVRTTARTCTSVTLAWGAKANARSFVVFGDIGDHNMIEVARSSKRRTTIRNLDRNSRHVLYVGARNAAGEMSPLKRIVTMTRR